MIQRTEGSLSGREVHQTSPCSRFTRRAAAAAGKVAVEGGGCHAEALGDLLNGDGGVTQQGLGGGQVLLREGRGATAQAPALAGGLKARAGALLDNRALELRQAREDVKHQPAAGSRRVDGLGERAKSDAALLQVLDGLDELPDRAGEAIQLPDDQGVAAAHEVKRGLELGPVALSAGSLLGEGLLAAAALEGVELERGVLILRGDAGVADEHRIVVSIIS